MSRMSAGGTATAGARIGRGCVVAARRNRPKTWSPPACCRNVKDSATSSCSGRIAGRLGRFSGRGLLFGRSLGFWWRYFKANNLVGPLHARDGPTAALVGFSVDGRRGRMAGQLIARLGTRQLQWLVGLADAELGEHEASVRRSTWSLSRQLWLAECFQPETGDVGQLGLHDDLVGVSSSVGIAGGKDRMIGFNLELRPLFGADLVGVQHDPSRRCG